MASQAQMRANLENAQKSTGPTSIEGKTKIKYECYNAWHFFKDASSAQ